MNTYKATATFPVIASNVDEALNVARDAVPGGASIGAILMVGGKSICVRADALGKCGVPLQQNATEQSKDDKPGTWIQAQCYVGTGHYFNAYVRSGDPTPMYCNEHLTRAEQAFGDALQCGAFEATPEPAPVKL